MLLQKTKKRSKLNPLYATPPTNNLLARHTPVPLVSLEQLLASVEAEVNPFALSIK